MTARHPQLGTPRRPSPSHRYLRGAHAAPGFRRAFSGLVLALASAFTACQSENVSEDSAPRILKIVVQANQEDEDYHGALALKEHVEAATDGGLQVRIYTGGQLCGSNRECLEAVMLGIVEVFMATTGGSAGVFPEVQVLDIPYLLTDDASAERVLAGDFRATLQRAVLERTGSLRLMTIGNTGGWRSLATKDRPVRTPEDMHGLKLRTVSSDLQIAFVEALGGSPTPIAWPEVYTSLATGIVDGTKNSVTDIVGMHFHDYIQHVTLDRHGYMAALWWMNDPFFQDLPPAWQLAVQEGFDKLRAVTLAIPKQRETAAIEAFLAKGGQIHQPDASERARFHAAAKPVRDWYVQKYGAQWLETLQDALQAGDSRSGLPAQK